MEFFEKEMREMFEGATVCHNPQFVGKTMLATLDADLRVKLEFASSRNNQQYDAIRVMIINRKAGVVDNQVFKFSDIIGEYVGEEGKSPMDYHVWMFRGARWHTPISTADKMKVADRILRYVALYRS